MSRRSRVSIQKRQRESRKSERRIRKAERAAAKRDQPAETPALDSVTETPGSTPRPEAPDSGLRDQSVAPDNPVA